LFLERIFNLLYYLRVRQEANDAPLR
jgi:hypothetical protein